MANHLVSPPRAPAYKAGEANSVRLARSPRTRRTLSLRRSNMETRNPPLNTTKTPKPFESAEAQTQSHDPRKIKHNSLTQAMAWATEPSSKSANHPCSSLQAGEANSVRLAHDLQTTDDRRPTRRSRIETRNPPRNTTKTPKPFESAGAQTRSHEPRKIEHNSLPPGHGLGHGNA